MAPLYSAYAGEQVTVAQLLGEEQDDAAAQADAIADAEIRLTQMLNRNKGSA